MDSKRVFIGRLNCGCTQHVLWERIYNEGRAGVRDLHMGRKGGFVPGKRIVAIADFDTVENAARLVDLYGSLWPEVVA